MTPVQLSPTQGGSPPVRPLKRHCTESTTRDVSPPEWAPQDDFGELALVVSVPLTACTTIIFDSDDIKMLNGSEAFVKRNKMLVFTDNEVAFEKLCKDLGTEKGEELMKFVTLGIGHAMPASSVDFMILFK
jgi:hypothetical protein